MWRWSLCLAISALTIVLSIAAHADTATPKLTSPATDAPKSVMTSAPVATPTLPLQQTPALAPIARVPTPQGGSFWQSFSPPLWVVLIINLATLVAAGFSAWAALRTAPKTALAVADKQAAVARDAVAASVKSAEAAREAAIAATLNAQAAARSAINQGVHAVARLRQEWINVAQSTGRSSSRAPVELATAFRACDRGRNRG